ncbi:MAG: glycine/betaine ABC transporter substrate-binding protein [Deltaproteobacteria bacterium]|nr:MAG: glycine/betaine ABC transporter substrate-binding protein [Deltaproteobacteria bacterium]
MLVAHPGRNALKHLMVIALMLLFTTGVALADTIRFVSLSWTGVTVKTELGVQILKSLGYDASNTMVSVPIVYKALDSDNADVFLGNWMPSMASIADPYFKKGTVEKYVASMPGAQYTLAVPAYVKKAGLKHFKDIAKFGEQLDYKIYGIEEGNDGNLVIQKMIDANLFGLGKFELVPSSEAGMLAQVQSFARAKKWIVFLGWSPHYMNKLIDMAYLDGSDANTFGVDNGQATVYTNIRKGFDKAHPNVANFLKNYTFPISMMNEIMTLMHNDQDLEPRQAGLDWVKLHPEVYKKWFDGVTTQDGKPALAAFEAYLKTL